MTDTAAPLNRLGLAAAARGDFEDALAAFARATESDPAYAVAWNNRGLVLQSLGRLADAVGCYDRALAARPDYAEALANRGWARSELGDPAGALADYDAAEASAGADFRPTVLHNRGTLRHRIGDLPGALTDLDEAVALAPHHLGTRVNRGSARKDAGDLPGALADLDHAVARLPAGRAATALHSRGGVKALLRDFRGAVADYDDALASEPGDYCLYLSRAFARYHLRDPLALADLEVAFRLDPDAAAAEAARVVVDDARRRADEVMENCDKHVRIDPGDLLAYVRRGLTGVALGRAAEAEEDFRRCRVLLEVRRPRSSDQWEFLRRVIAHAESALVDPALVRRS